MPHLRIPGLRLLLPLAATSALLLASGAATATAQITAQPTSQRTDSVAGWWGAVSVSGDVAQPLRLTPSEIAARPQLSLPDLRRPATSGRQISGAELLPLVAASQPVLPAVKNAQLRVILTVTARCHAPLTLTLGELDPNVGNHPALLVARKDGTRALRTVDLVIPGDLGFRRTVHDVSSIRVSVVAPTIPDAVSPGAVRITSGHRGVTLSRRTLASLPRITRTVAFQSGSGPQTHVETGPTLASVLRAARISPTPTTSVAAVASDGYVAAVTPAEAISGRRTLMLSLVEDHVRLDRPRLVTDGDVAGGRYVSGVVALDVRGAFRR